MGILQEVLSSPISREIPSFVIAVIILFTLDRHVSGVLKSSMRVEQIIHDNLTAQTDTMREIRDVMWKIAHELGALSDNETKGGTQ